MQRVSPVNLQPANAPYCSSGQRKLVSGLRYTHTKGCAVLVDTKAAAKHGGLVLITSPRVTTPVTQLP